MANSSFLALQSFPQFRLCASGKISEVSSFILGRTHLHTLLLAAVIYKSFMAAGDGPVALCCSEMLSLAGVSGGTDCGSGTSWSRAAPGHTQQAHTGEVYMLGPAS